MFERLQDRMSGHPPSRSRFADRMRHAIQMSGYKETLIFEPEQFRFVYGKGACFYLGNAYDDYSKASRAERAGVLERYARVLQMQTEDEDPSLDEVRHLLVPVIRNRAAVFEMENQRRLDGGDADVTLQCRPFGPDCVTLLAIDRPEATTTLTAGPPAQWSIDLDGALAIAHENLRAATADGWDALAPGVLQGPWSDSYEPSRALLADVLERAPVKGRPVFMIPTRDTLLVTGDRDDAGLLSMVELAHAACGRSGRWISAHLYRYDDARQPTVFALGAGEARERQRDLATLLLSDGYAAQKTLLDHQNELHERDVFVATFAVRERSDSVHLVSFCTWTRGVDSLLPRADSIAFAIPGEDGSEWNHILVGWDAAMPIVDHLLEQDPACEPRRYRTLGFPDAAAFEHLRALAY